MTLSQIFCIGITSHGLVKHRKQRLKMNPGRKAKNFESYRYATKLLSHQRLIQSTYFLMSSPNRSIHRFLRIQIVEYSNDIAVFCIVYIYYTTTGAQGETPPSTFVREELPLFNNLEGKVKLVAWLFTPYHRLPKQLCIGLQWMDQQMIFLSPAILTVSAWQRWVQTRSSQNFRA